MFKKLLILSAALLGMACSDKKTEDNTLPIPPAGYTYAAYNTSIAQGKLISNMLFYGAAVVHNSKSGGVFTDSQALYEFIPEANSDQVWLYMHTTKFAAAMPPIKMRMKAKPTFDAGKMTLTLDEVIPQSYVAEQDTWVDQPAYLLTNVKWQVEGTLCSVVFTCDRYASTSSFAGLLIVKVN